MKSKIQEEGSLSKEKHEAQVSRPNKEQSGKAFGKLLPKKGGSEIREDIPRIRKYSAAKEREGGGGKSVRTEGRSVSRGREKLIHLGKELILIFLSFLNDTMFWPVFKWL